MGSSVTSLSKLSNFSKYCFRSWLILCLMLELCGFFSLLLDLDFLLYFSFFSRSLRFCLIRLCSSLVNSLETPLPYSRSLLYAELLLTLDASS